MTTDEARALYSEYLEGALDDEAKDQLQAFLAQTPTCAAELIGLERTLTLVHRLPPREPVLDLWREFAPRMAEYQAERKRSARERLTQNWYRLMSQISAGVILWTHTLADRAHDRLERYLTRDPLSPFHPE